MSSTDEKFARFSLEHARLYAPESAESSFTLVPLDPRATRPSSPKQRKKEPRTKKSRGRVKASTDQQNAADLRNIAQTVGNDEPLDINFPALYLSGSDHASFEEEPISIAAEGFIEPEGDPNIEISVEPGGQLFLFQDTRFDISAPGAHKVEMVWRSPIDGWIERAAMDHIKGDAFSSMVGLADRDYLLGFDVDGDLRPDPRYARQVYVQPDGIFSSLRLTRYTRLCEIHNNGSEDENATLRVTAPWIEAPGEIFLPARQRVRLSIRLLPRKMAQGRNEGELEIIVRRKGQEIIAAVSRISAVAEPGGAVPVFLYHPAGYGSILQGIDRLELTVSVRAAGSGRLSGMIYLPQQGEVADFQIESGDGSFTQKFSVDSAALAHRTEGSLKANIVTDCYLANYRQFSFEIPYRLIYLKKSVPALSFGRVRKGETATLRLEVERSDGGEVDLEVEVPQAAACLSAFRARAAAYSFRFDTRELQPGARLNETIALIDRLSGLRDQIKAVGEVVAQRAGARR